ncbi:hypothetical protein [Streptomyces avidinii]|uniref:Uncharacterized protein n=1 Tax=Streptomyces avidinii TaxID=1895 RepID=A0ABS4L192_STRAV|nr:hypothetical protein [Streptomyces avidinii]MBP2035660.1 hypothetical protein [Streptomyces avidinii]GGZ00587.1 hypothetical protein GCM10010343_27920 [Streptomyces avidinii]
MTAITRLPAAAAGPAAARTHLRLRPVGRPGRDGARATTSAAGASLPADCDHEGRAAVRPAARPTDDRPSGPEGHRSTGEHA